MKESLRMAQSLEKEFSSFIMEIFIRGNMRMDFLKVMDNIHGKINQVIKDSLNRD
jgi:hypothetical protein